MNKYLKATGIVQSHLVHLVTVDAATPNRASILVQQDCRILEVSAVARAKSGGLLTGTIMVEKGGANLLSAAMEVGGAAAGTRVTGALTDSAGVRASKGDVITVDIDAITAAESMTDVDIQIDYMAED